MSAFRSKESRSWPKFHLELLFEKLKLFLKFVPGFTNIQISKSFVYERFNHHSVRRRPGTGNEHRRVLSRQDFPFKRLQVIGLHEGYTGLFRKEARTEDIDFFKADAYFNRGGSYLQMSRFKPTNEDFEQNFNLALFQDNNVKLLVTVGGDDTASTANRSPSSLRPRTIRSTTSTSLRRSMTTFHCLTTHRPSDSTPRRTVRTSPTPFTRMPASGNWLLISAMGRSAGHLALGIGEATHCPMTIIPEMFNNTTITVDKIIKLTLSAIIKRKILGIPYGTVVVAEGVFHDLEPEDIKATGVHMTYDEHGHPELGKISKAVLFNDILEKEFKKIGMKVKTRLSRSVTTFVARITWPTTFHTAPNSLSESMSSSQRVRPDVWSMSMRTATHSLFT